MYTAALVSLILDQAAVWIVIHRFPDLVSHTERWFWLVNQPWSSLAALLIVAFLIRKHQSVGLGLVLGGAASNLLTFLLQKSAVDYIPFFGVTTNLADSLIVVGLIWIAVRELRLNTPEV